ncbi:SNF2-related protein [Prevotella copri]|jgi:SNF2 family DNA or RNA helicase|uniref:SNF2-related protein n=1 Tax=Segatella copri TaxID=165179 RepID=A0AAW5IHY7_9BACT|nr:helicase-related protein [Segatella copri]MCP9534488.1 SNF2-related protein [Segatella copri]MCP9537426.1 SNF2-related protein [Segatella copri]MCP9540423.1 SNF2-related protein [Segatella copri]MCP9559444.1 SNF2-related protein [Segatella copri]MCP9562187.1 SNF2-related protein [Segatella copri]
MEQPKQINNTSERLIDDLKSRLSTQSRISIAAASFSIYAFEAMKAELEKVEEVRFIFTSPTFVADKTKKEKREFYIPKLNRERNLYGTEFEIKLRNQLSQKAIAKESAAWIRKKVKFKSNSSQEGMGGFLHLCDGEPSALPVFDMNAPSKQHVYLPFDDFSTTQLGCEKGNNVYTMVNVLPSPSAEAYLQIFNQQWENDEKFKDVTARVLEYIETVYQENAPEYIYFIALYNIFHEFLEDISEDVLPNERTGFKNSHIWNKLYNFQKDAALAIINKLEKYNGCILADSVGLGKTFTALAVIKYYENRNKSVLVLCPKKLNENWITFRSNYKNNPIAGDRLRYDILFHTDLSREHGSSNGLDLDHINWGNYDLVVIDESHNFRNGGNVDEEEDDDDELQEERKENRYQKLMNRVIRTGVKTKVLMLSATPVNNRFGDLKNQLQLAYEGRSSSFDEALGLGKNVDDIFTNAQKVYNHWAKLKAEERTTERLLNDLSYDFFQLLDAVTIARSRSHIMKYYDTSAIGEFPHRLPPISRRPKLTDISNAINFKDIATELDNLNLSIYTPSLYLHDSARNSYTIDYEGSGLSIDGREKGLRNLMATNLLKRLESSVNSFRLTLERITAYIDETILLIDQEAEEIRGFRLRDMDYISWRRDLSADQEVLRMLLLMLEDITPAHDSKLQMLIADLKEKFAHPINKDNRKVLIFTAFADTADYLYQELAERIKADCGLNVALITGSTEGKCTIPKFECTFNNVLTFFSPISKDKDDIFDEKDCAKKLWIHENIDVLIATDCISEGQNLQDCDYLINYDIHWNPVRIIQRFGRIDRIGSRNKEIQLVNYWPDMELDEYIQLKGRVESRMKATILTSTGDDNLLSDNEKGDLEYRRKQLKHLQEEVVDIEDMDTGINIMDLGLNEFRLDLLSYIKEHPDIEHAPFGMNAVAGTKGDIKPGVIYVLKNRNNAVNIDKKNLLHPFYMVYLSDDGEVICDHLHPKKLLDTLRLLCKDKKEYDRNLCALLSKDTSDGRHMEHYSDLLQKAIDSMVRIKEESDIDSLFSLGETTALTNEIKGLDDFELITFLVIK